MLPSVYRAGPMIMPETTPSPVPASSPEVIRISVERLQAGIESISTVWAQVPGLACAIIAMLGNGVGTGPPGVMTLQVSGVASDWPSPKVEAGNGTSFLLSEVDPLADDLNVVIGGNRDMVGMDIEALGDDGTHRAGPVVGSPFNGLEQAVGSQDHPADRLHQLVDPGSDLRDRSRETAGAGGDLTGLENGGRNAGPERRRINADFPGTGQAEPGTGNDVDPAGRRGQQQIAGAGVQDQPVGVTVIFGDYTAGAVGERKAFSLRTRRLAADCT